MPSSKTATTGTVRLSSPLGLANSTNVKHEAIQRPTIGEDANKTMTNADTKKPILPKMVFRNNNTLLLKLLPI